MRFLHLSDLHLGKRVYEFSMLEEQKHILNQIRSIALSQRVDGVLIAGDIYDKAVPSAEAVQVLDGFLTKLAESKIAVYAISGNHDSPERLAFGAELMSGRGVFFSSVYDGDVRKVRLEDSYGELNLFLCPFLKPSLVRRALGDEGVETYQDAVAAAVERMEVDRGQRNLLVAHQFITGADRCESEELAVGGLDNVDASVYDAFDYVALGHIHSPQDISRKTIRYCGSPLKYSFSEAEQEKSVTVLDVRGKGDLEIWTIPLVPLHDMRRLKGSYMEVTARETYKGTATDDYIQITLTDEEDVPDGFQKLRTIYPNLMHLEYDNQRTRGDARMPALEHAAKKSKLELFEEFFVLQNNRPMSGPQREFLKGLIRRLQEEPDGGMGT